MIFLRRCELSSGSGSAKNCKLPLNNTARGFSICSAVTVDLGLSCSEFELESAAVPRICSDFKIGPSATCKFAWRAVEKK